MKRIYTYILLTIFALCALAILGAKPKEKAKTFAQLDKRFLMRVDPNNRPVPIRGDEESVMIRPTVKRHNGHNSGAVGPGKFLMNSEYDFGSNGGVNTNLVDYGNGTLAVGRMGATVPGTTADRGTFFSYFDGTSWTPMTKVETLRRGWSNISALADGRSVTVSHQANEVNVDAAPGLGIWTSTLTGFATTTAAIWARLTVDGKDNIIVVSTINGGTNPTGVGFAKDIAISRDGGATFVKRSLIPDTSVFKPSFSADDQSLDSFGDKVAFAVADFGRDIHLWESADNGNTWTYRNLTNYPNDIPVGAIQSRPWDTCDLLYDNAGNLHIFWEAILATQDTAGTAINLDYSIDIGIQHWSQAAAFSQAVAYADIPNGTQDMLLLAAGEPFDQTNADMTFLGQPQGGVDAQGNLYLLFAALSPNDMDTDSTHFTDLYAVGSKDGGKTWGSPVNITNTPKSEDLWASLARNIGDSLRFVYQSDGTTGNSIQAGGAGPSTFLYFAIHKSRIPLGPTAVEENDPSKIPAAFALRQNYPNPFNPATTIDFSLPANANVKLEIYNALGQKVATLIDGKVAAGSHTVNWNAANVPSGLYFYKLEAENFSQTRKMVLMK